MAKILILSETSKCFKPKMAKISKCFESEMTKISKCLDNDVNKKLPRPSVMTIAAALSRNMGVPSADYIMPPIPGFMAGAAGAGSGLSAITHSVVRNMPATEAAFCRATRVTLVGSMTPAASRFS